MNVVGTVGSQEKIDARIRLNEELDYNPHARFIDGVRLFLDGNSDSFCGKFTMELKNSMFRFDGVRWKFTMELANSMFWYTAYG